MKKTYWWRILALSVFLGGIAAGYMIFYPYKAGICNLGEKCVFSSLKKTIAEPLFLLSLFFSATSIFLFFTTDKTFLKWLKLAVGWAVFSVLALILIPDQQEGLLSFGGPDKEAISIWLGALFLLSSLGLIVWEGRKWEK